MAVDDNSGTRLPSGAQQMPTARLDSEASRWLADHLSLLRDLEFVGQCCDRILTMRQKPEEEQDSVLEQALWSAALVAYTRCFGTGKRFGLHDRDVEQLGLEGEVVEFHRFLTNLRNKHIAHSVNPFETVLVGAVLTPKGQPDRRVEGVGWLHIAHDVADDQGVKQVYLLAHRLAELVRARAERQREVVRSEAEAMGIAVLDGRPGLGVHVPGPDDAARPRQAEKPVAPRGGEAGPAGVLLLGSDQ